MTSLAQVAVFLAASVIAIPLFRKLGLGSVLGYLAAGITIGPWGVRVVQDAEGVLHVAELGVVLLLFVIGLELQPSRLRAMRRAIFGLGASQVCLTTLVFTVTARLCGLAWTTAFVAGFALSLSSTPMVLQLLAERGQLKTHYGRSGFAILLFQDVAVMPLLAVLPLLGMKSGAQELSATLLMAGKGLGVMVLLVFGGRYVLRPALRIIAETKVNEAFTAAALLVVIGTALLFDAVGLSMALGAFVAGLLLADSEYRHELEADIEPFKGLLLGLFFMSVGMTANLGLLLEKPALVAALVCALLLVKALLLWAVGRMNGHTNADSRGLAFALPQAGEFGFVLFSLAVAYGVMEPALADLLVIVVTLSMIASPLLMMLHERIERQIKPALPAFDIIESHEGRVIVAGFGRFGQIIGRVLRMRRIPFTALESSVTQVDFVRRFGNKVYYGDASRLEVLSAAGASTAEVLVLAIDDVEASVRAVEMVRKHYPHLKILARARNRQHAIRLQDLGVHYMIRETFLSGLDMAQQTLETLGMSRTEALDSVHRFRTHDEHTLELQREALDDEKKLIQTVQQAAAELELLFETDESRTERIAAMKSPAEKQ